MTDDGLRAALARIDPKARDDLRRVLIRDQPDRDAIAEQLFRRRTVGADQLADLIDMLTIDNEARRHVVRIIGELQADG